MPSIPLTGLAKQWDENETIRRRLTSQHRLLFWKSPEVVGVVSFKAASANYDVLLPFFEKWCSLSEVCRAPLLKNVKKEARSSSGFAFCKHFLFHSFPFKGLIGFFH